VTKRFKSGPLGVPAFRLLAGGQFASTIGDYCYAVALPWFVLSNHGSTILLGIVLACYGVPRTILIPLGGALADKAGPRLMMLCADLMRCVLIAALAILASRHDTSLALLGPTAALIGAGEGLFLPASFSIMPSLLAEEQLQAGNALSQGLTALGSMVGPALGGAMVAAGGPAPAFWVDAASFAVSAAALALIRSATEPKGAVLSGPASESGNTAPGSTSMLTLLRRSRILQLVLLVAVAANFALAGTSDIALPALAHARFGADGFGALIACLGAGSVLGAVLASRSGSMSRQVLIASFGFIGGAVVLSFVPYAGGEAGAAVAMFLFGAAIGFGNIVYITELQKWAPAESIGRIMALLMLAVIGAFPISAAIAGVLVHHIGPAVFFPIAGGVVAVTMLIGLTQRELRDFGSRMPRDDKASEPKIQQDGNHRPF